MTTHDWDKHNWLEYDMIHDDIAKLPEKSIVLLHCLEKAQMYNLIPLGSMKICRKKMLEIAKERGGFREPLTILNWDTIKDAVIYETFEEMEKRIQELIGSCR